MFCTSCGASLPADAEFCTGCGARIVSQNTPNTFSNPPVAAPPPVSQTGQYFQAAPYPPASVSGNQLQPLGDPGFLKALFDLDFSHFTTPKVAKIIYPILIGFIGLAYVLGLYTNFRIGTTAGLIFLIVGTAGAFLALLLARMSLEYVTATIRTAENTAQIVQQQRSQNL